MRHAEFYLDIARSGLNELKRCTGPIVVGDCGYSEHFRHAIVITVFSALAVEHAITEVIWIECFLKTPAPHRNKTLQLVKMLRNIPDKLEFLQSNGLLPLELKKEVSELFDRRNRLVHLRSEEVIPYSGGVLDVEDVQTLNEQGRGAQLDVAMERALVKGKFEDLDALANEVGKPSTSLSLPGLSTLIVHEAKENLEIAERTLKALENERGLAEGDVELK